MNVFKNFWLVLFLLFCLNFSNASTTPIKEARPTGFYITPLFGLSWLFAGSTQNVTLAPQTVNQYDPNTASNMDGLFLLSLAYSLKSCSAHWHAVGLDVAYTSHTNLQGIVIPFINFSTAFDRLQYRYTVKNIPIFFLYQFGYRFSPRWSSFVTAGLGFSINQASQYSELPFGTAAPMEVPFQQHTQVQFAFDVGAGLSTAISKRISASLEYRYISYGNAGFKPSPLETTGEGLNLGHLDSHNLLFGFTVRV